MIYLLKCKVCKKQYLGKATDEFWLSETITRTTIEIKVVCNSIFMRILIASVITDSWGMFLTDKTGGFEPMKRENYWIRILKNLAVGPNLESTVWHFMCQIRVLLLLFWTELILELEIWIRLWCFCITPVIIVSASFGGYSIY